MAVDHNMHDDESDLIYYTMPDTGKVYSSMELEDLSSIERRRLQRQDPERPWLVDGAMPRQKDVNPMADLRRIVYIRDEFRCQGCGGRFISEVTLARADFYYDGLHNVQGLTLGHIVPKSKGGAYSEENIKAQCKPCNNALGDGVWTVFI